MPSDSSNPSKFSQLLKKWLFLRLFVSKSKAPRHQPTTGDTGAPTTSPSLIVSSPTMQSASWGMAPYTQEPGPIGMMSLAAPALGTFPFPSPSVSQNGYTSTDFDSESIDSEYSEGYTSPSSHTNQVQGYAQQEYTQQIYTSQSGHGSVTVSAYQASTHHSYPSNAVVSQTAYHSQSGGGRSQTLTYTQFTGGGHEINSYTNNSVNITGNNQVIIFPPR